MVVHQINFQALHYYIKNCKKSYFKLKIITSLLHQKKYLIEVFLKKTKK